MAACRLAESGADSKVKHRLKPSEVFIALLAGIEWKINSTQQKSTAEKAGKDWVGLVGKKSAVLGVFTRANQTYILKCPITRIGRSIYNQLCYWTLIKRRDKTVPGFLKVTNWSFESSSENHFSWNLNQRKHQGHTCQTSRRTANTDESQLEIRETNVCGH